MAADVCNDMLAASEAALKWLNVSLDIFEDNEAEDDPDKSRGIGEAPCDEQYDKEIWPPPPPDAEVTGVEWTRPAEVAWITDPMPCVGGVATKSPAKTF